MAGAKIFQTLLHPNNITTFRMFLVPVLIIIMLFEPTPALSLVTAIIFAVAAVTDFFDGYIARKYNLISTYGKIMDPLADKLLVAAAMIMLIPQERLAAWLVCVILAREFAITGLRITMVERKMDVAASWLGKFKTNFQLFGILFLLVHYNYWGINFQFIGTILIYIAMVFTLWSGADYVWKFKKALKD